MLLIAQRGTESHDAYEQYVKHYRSLYLSEEAPRAGRQSVSSSRTDVVALKSKSALSSEMQQDLQANVAVDIGH